ncbi:zinc ribbon domain-containing protein [Frigoriglobus tundricola]|uniref:Zinc finger/thioredoxin putative domain-containing protein n=1 Tax=Frigoriglobus tundricola TaxID=2774151 RepID=A0A6M5YI03_9BACT|nr:hypothetical protein [Frigoriglobus tundricola]QJW93675.1 hypothetical protein FTUN_1183 [Frigoriglobus tundricola]
MRLICPHCMSGVTVPDDAAGKEATCSNCGKSFPTPARYAATVVPEVPAVAGPIDPVRTSPHPEPPPMSSTVPPVAPPGYVPPAPPPTPDGFLTPAASAGPVQAGYAHSFGITISPHVVSWLPAALLLFVMVFTFFPWVGCYSGGVPVYSQRPWTAVYGSVSPNFELEDAVSIPPGWQNKVSSDWPLMVPYLVLLLLATALAWADRGLHAFDPRKIPPLARVWPHRQTIVCVLATLAFLLAALQVSNGFGMERAIRKQVGEEFTAKQQLTTEPHQKEKLAWRIDQEYYRYKLERTTWMYLALLFNLFAALAVILRLGLDRRGPKPPPKILLHY